MLLCPLPVKVGDDGAFVVERQHGGVVVPGVHPGGSLYPAVPRLLQQRPAAAVGVGDYSAGALADLCHRRTAQVAGAPGGTMVGGVAPV